MTGNVTVMNFIKIMDKFFITESNGYSTVFISGQEKLAEP